MIFCRLKYIIFLCFFSGIILSGQSIPLPSGSAAGFAVGQATVAWNDEHAVLNNQAGMLGIENWGIQMSAANLYGLGSLNILTASATKKLNNNNAIGLSIKHIGDSDFNNQIIGLAYARKVLRNLDISLQLDLLSYQAKRYGNKYLATVEFGTMVQATKKLRVGFHVFNPFAQKLTAQEDISSIFRLGAIYTLSDKVHMMGEVEKDLLQAYNFKAGINYAPVKNLYLRIGVTTSGRQLHFGLAYQFGNFALHGSSSVHQQLGITSAAELSFKN